MPREYSKRHKSRTKDFGGVTVTPLPLAPGADPATQAYRYDYKFGDTRGGVISVNFNFFYEPEAKVWDVGGTKLSMLDMLAQQGIVLDRNQYQAWVIAHELAHIFSVPEKKVDTVEFGRALAKCVTR